MDSRSDEALPADAGQLVRGVRRAVSEARVEELRAAVEAATAKMNAANAACQAARKNLRQCTNELREALEPGSTGDAVLSALDEVIQEALMPHSGQCLFTRQIEELLKPQIAAHPTLSQHQWSRVRIGKAMHRLGFRHFTTRLAKGWRL